MSDVLWEEPPAPAQRAPSFKERLAPLTAQPGEWAVVGEYKNSNTANVTATQLRNGKLPTPEGDWEFRSGARGGMFAVWARYVGPMNEPAAVTAGQ